MSLSVSDLLHAWGEPTPATEALWKRAESDLLISVGGGKSDPFVWEHSVRVTGLALQITRFPEVSGQRVDRVGLVAAGLYHDAGWVVQIRRQEVSRFDACGRPTSDAQRELAAALFEETAAKLLPDASARVALRALREWGQRSGSPCIESMLVAEAESLEHVGPQAVWLTMRRQATEPRGISAVLDAWHRQQEYHYWEARLQEGFRYETTRRIARQRLQAVERFMADLRRCHRLEDVVESSEEPRGPVANAIGRTRG